MQQAKHQNTKSLFLRHSGLGNPQDYAVFYRHDDGRELGVGRIFYNNPIVGGERPWFWGIQFFQREGRAGPHQDRSTRLRKPKPLGASVGVPLMCRSTGRLR
jgi:hypothetical protein